MARIIDTGDPVAVAAVDAIHQGDAARLRQLLADNPDLATAQLGTDGQCGTTRSLLHVATDWPGHHPNSAATIAVLVEQDDRPLPYIRRAAAMLAEAAATLVAGHSAHVPHGVAVAGRALVLYDLGDFLGDYTVDLLLRNDLGLLWLVPLDRQGPVRLKAIPLKLGYCTPAWPAGRTRPGYAGGSRPPALYLAAGSRSARPTAAPTAASWSAGAEPMVGERPGHRPIGHRAPAARAQCARAMCL